MSMDTTVQILAIIWNAGAIPMLLGTITSGMTQYVKMVPALATFINNENVWLTRGFIVIGCVVMQLLFDLISRQPISVSIIHDMIVNYFAASVSYTHIFKPIEPSPKTTN